MVVFVLILLLLAAMGILGAVIKVTLVLVMSFVLAILVAAVGGYYFLRHRFRKYVKETQAQQGVPPGQTGPGPQRGYPTTGTKGPGLPE
jgi:cation transport ATPase